MMIMKRKIWKRTGIIGKWTILNRRNQKMIIPEMTNLEKDSSENKESEKGQFWKGTIWKRTILERSKPKKDKYEQENLEKDSSGNPKNDNSGKEILKIDNSEQEHSERNK